MPLIVEQVIEQVSPTFSNENVEKKSDPIFGAIVISAILLYLFRGMIFSLVKFGMIGFLTFTLFKLIA